MGPVPGWLTMHHNNLHHKFALNYIFYFFIDKHNNKIVLFLYVILNVFDYIDFYLDSHIAVDNKLVHIDEMVMLSDV